MMARICAIARFLSASGFVQQDASLSIAQQARQRGLSPSVANNDTNNVGVIDTATNTVSAVILVGLGPEGVAVTPDGSKVYVANFHSNTVSVIDTATNAVSATVPVGVGPIAFGVFIQPPRAGQPPSFAGVAESVSALAHQFGGLDAAAAALGFSTVQGLRDAIRAFCEG